MRIHSLLIGLVAAALIALVASTAVRAEWTEPAPHCAEGSGEILVDGDLLYMKAADDFTALLAQTATSGAKQVRVHVACAEARMEVIVAMARAIRTAGIPVHVHLADRSPHDGRVDPATRPPMQARYLLLAASADSASMMARLPFREESRPGAAGDETMGQTVQQAVELMTEGLTHRGMDAEVAATLARAALEPQEALWLVLDAAGHAKEISRVAPSGQLGVELVTSYQGVPVFLLSAKDAARAGFAFTTAPGAGEAEPSAASDRSSGKPLEVRGDEYSRRADRARQWLPSIDNLLKNIDEVLDLPDPAKRSVSKDTYRKAGQRGLEKIAQTQEQIEALEQDLRDFPELLRTAPPGQTDVGAKPSSFAAKWRSMIQSRKDKLARLKEKAEEFGRE